MTFWFFKVSTLDDTGHSLQTRNIEFSNTDNYSKFTGTFLFQNVKEI